MRFRIEFDGGSKAEVFVKPSSFVVSEDGLSASVQLTFAAFPFDPRTIKAITAWDLSRPEHPTKWEGTEMAATVDGDEDGNPNPPGVRINLSQVATG